MATNFDAIGIPDFYTPDLRRSTLLTGVPITLAATGSVAGDAAAVVQDFTSVTAGDGTVGVILPAVAAGRIITVYNAGSGTLKIYPPTGGNIDGAGANTAVTLASKLVKSFVYVSTTVQATISTSAAGIQDGGVQAAEVTFTETTGAGTYTGSVAVPAGATILDIVVNGVAVWNTATSATMIVGDVADDNGYYTGVDLKATDLLAGESISFTAAGGKAGAYIANSQVSPRYSATARVVSGIIATVGTTGTLGRTRMTVYYSVNTAGAATKV